MMKTALKTITSTEGFFTSLIVSVIILISCGYAQDQNSEKPSSGSNNTGVSMDVARKNVIVAIGPQQLISDDMGYKELEEFFRHFQGKLGMCSIDGESDALFLPKEDGKFKRLPWPESESKEYRVKKKELLEAMGKVIEYIAKEYTMPLDELRKRHTTTRNYWGVQGICCEWHLRVLAQRGDAEAQLELGEMLIRPYSSDKIEGIEWLKYCANNGSARACLILGTLSLEVNNYEAAIDWYKEGVRLGDSNCMYALGNFAYKMLREQDCSLKWYEIALDWYEKAAILGHYKSIEMCAELYSDESLASFIKPAPKLNFRRAIQYYQELIQRDENFIKTEEQKPESERNGWEINRCKYRIEKNKKTIEELTYKIED